MTRPKRSRYLFTSLMVALLATLLFVSQAPQVTLALTPTVTKTFTPTVTPTGTAAIVCSQIVVTVYPLISPTSALTQIITARATGGGLYQFTINVSDPAGNSLGIYRSTSGPSAVAVEIALQPNTTHRITVSVSGEVACHQGNNNFFTWGYGGTSNDTNGNPLVIVQQSGGVSPTPTATATATPNIARWDGHSHHYQVNDLVRYKEGTIYKCLQDHISQLNWYPPVAPALWQKVG